MRKNILISVCTSILIFSCTNENTENRIAIPVDSAKTNTNPPVISSPPIIRDTISPHSITQSELPEGITFKGDLHQAYSWYDKNGRNILVLSTTSLNVKAKEFDTEENTKELIGKLYVIKSGVPELIWNLYEVQKKCVFDLTLDLVTTPDICDADNNGIDEVYILYKTSCRSDAYPSNMKLIAHEGKQKFALRGLMVFRFTDFPDTLFTNERELDLSKIPEEELKNTPMREYGCFENTNDFKNANDSILLHAKTYWRNNIMEN
jgi:hypothetical protein